MKNLEILSPVGSMESLIAAVQNGADAVYFGAKLFNARNYASNFDDEQLEYAIRYTKTRNVKSYLTLNILLKDSEMQSALEVVKTAYTLGIDAVIVQDIGLATLIHKYFPDLEMHASTQMSVYNLEGVKELEKIGFSRVVLARELSIDEITYICKNTTVEIECFVHGALCVSYSGQCLLSSLAGDRSGNRGKCAQVCRLPYDLHKGSKLIKSGYIISPKDLSTLEYIEQLKNSGIKSLKIEGRMKQPEYVALTTRTYKELLEGNVLTEEMKQNILQIFNRGNFTKGFIFKDKAEDIIYPIKPKNLGTYLGKIEKYNIDKKLITITLEQDLDMHDGIETLDEKGSTIVTEILYNNEHVTHIEKGSTVQLGRINGDLSIGSDVYRTSSKELNKELALSFNGKEYKRIPVDTKIEILKDNPVKVTLGSIEYISDIFPQLSVNKPLTEETIITQMCKTNDYPFDMNITKISLYDSLFLPLSQLNVIRNNAMLKYLEYVESKIKRVYSNNIDLPFIDNAKNESSKKEIYIYLNKINKDSLNIQSVSGIYIPLRHFKNENLDLIKKLSEKQNVFLALPNILKEKISIEEFKEIKLKGLLISNISQLNYLNEFKNIELHADYHNNIFNSYAFQYYINAGVSNITLSPELSSKNINTFSFENSQCLIYGRIKSMTIQNCIVKDCANCPNYDYFIVDRINYEFPIITDPVNCTTNIYNSKILSFSPSKINTKNIRLDFFEENISDISTLISQFKTGNNPTGDNYTNGHFNKEV